MSEIAKAQERRERAGDGRQCQPDRQRHDVQQATSDLALMVSDCSARATPALTEKFGRAGCGTAQAAQETTCSVQRLRDAAGPSDLAKDVADHRSCRLGQWYERNRRRASPFRVQRWSGPTRMHAVARRAVGSGAVGGRKRSTGSSWSRSARCCECQHGRQRVAQADCGMRLRFCGLRNDCTVDCGPLTAGARPEAGSRWRRRPSGVLRLKSFQEGLLDLKRRSVVWCVLALLPWSCSGGRTEGSRAPPPGEEGGAGPVGQRSPRPRNPAGANPARRNPGRDGTRAGTEPRGRSPRPAGGAGGTGEMEACQRPERDSRLLAVATSCTPGGVRTAAGRPADFTPLFSPSVLDRGRRSQRCQPGTTLTAGLPLGHPSTLHGWPRDRRPSGSTLTHANNHSLYSKLGIEKPTSPERYGMPHTGTRRKGPVVEPVPGIGWRCWPHVDQLIPCRSPGRSNLVDDEQMPADFTGPGREDVDLWPSRCTSARVAREPEEQRYYVDVAAGW